MSRSTQRARAHTPHTLHTSHVCSCDSAHALTGISRVFSGCALLRRARTVARARAAHTRQPSSRFSGAAAPLVFPVTRATLTFAIRARATKAPASWTPRIWTASIAPAMKGGPAGSATRTSATRPRVLTAGPALARLMTVTPALARNSSQARTASHSSISAPPLHARTAPSAGARGAHSTASAPPVSGPPALFPHAMHRTSTFSALTRRLTSRV